MHWFSKAASVSILAGLMATPAMAQRVVVWPRVVRPPVVVRPYAPVIVRPYAYYGPGWTGYWGPGWYAPWRPAYVVGPSTGEVKIDTHFRNASVYVDRGYVGPIDKFKKFHLTPGNHDIELRDLSGETLFKERVQVILNKTIELKPSV
jgi:hypothetical protein